MIQSEGIREVEMNIKVMSSSEEEGDDRSPAARVVLKPLQVISVVLAGPGPDGADSEEGEGEGGEGPGGDGEPDPFQDLPEEVSAGDKLKQTTVGDAVHGLSGSP